MAAEFEELFTIPPYFDYGATFVWSLSGALMAAKRGYDFSGVVAVALVSSTGGGLIRDGLFLQQGPPALVRSPIFLSIVAATAILVYAVGSHLNRSTQLSPALHVVDALGLGAYAVVGMQLSEQAGLSIPAIMLVGVVNAVGGSILRDVLVRREPQTFLPGNFLAVAAMVSCVVFLVLGHVFHIRPQAAAWPTILTAALVRGASIRYNLRTSRIHGFESDMD